MFRSGRRRVDAHDHGLRSTALELVHKRMTASAEGYAAGWYAGVIVLERYLAGETLDHADWQADWATAMAMIRP